MVIIVAATCSNLINLLQHFFVTLFTWKEASILESVWSHNDSEGRQEAVSEHELRKLSQALTSNYYIKFHFLVAVWTEKKLAKSITLKQLPSEEKKKYIYYCHILYGQNLTYESLFTFCNENLSRMLIKKNLSLVVKIEYVWKDLYGLFIQ